MALLFMRVLKEGFALFTICYGEKQNIKVLRSSSSSRNFKSSVVFQMKFLESKVWK